MEELGMVSGFDVFKKELAPGILATIVGGGPSSMAAVELAPGDHVPEHTHEQHQYGVVVSGRLRLRVGAQERVLGPGQVYAIAPGVAHAAWVEEHMTRVVDFFTPTRPDLARPE